jgi:hypothetical protein
MLGSALCGGLVAADTEIAPHSIATFDQMPKTVTLKDGELMAFFHPILGEMHAATARLSSDNGHTWGELKTLFSLPEDAGAFGYTQVFCDHAGEVHLFLFCDAGSGQVGPRRAPASKKFGPLGKLDIWEAHTTGEGHTWLPPHRIWEGRAGDMQSVIQLRSGRLLLPLSYYIPRSWSDRGPGFDAFSWRGSFRSSMLYSDDGGETWKQSPAVLETPTTAIGELGAIEPVVIQLKDGRVWMLIRTQVGRFYETFSQDGVAWTPPRPSTIPSSDSPAGLVRLKDGRILLFDNDCWRFPYANGGRQVLHVALSDDEGKTWHGWREVLRDPLRDAPPPSDGDFGVSYPYPTLTSDGQVVFSLWVASSRTQRSLYAFDPKWVDETSQSEDFAHGLDAWSAYGTRGVEAVPNPDKVGAQMLQVRKTDADWPAAAVWNFPAGATGSVHLRIKLQPGQKGLLIGLTDQYSPPFDDQDELHNLYNVVIDAQGHIGKAALSAGEWHDLQLTWDTRAQQCRVQVDGRQVASIRQARLSSWLNYLRLRSTADDTTDDAGFLVESVQAQSNGNMTARVTQK